MVVQKQVRYLRSINSQLNYLPLIRCLYVQLKISGQGLQNRHVSVRSLVGQAQETVR
jgi:hypothetical protein